jgi:beta-galactosidase
LVTKDHIIAEEQHLLSGNYINNVNIIPAGKISLNEIDSTLNVTSSVMEIKFNRKTGLMGKYIVNGQSYINDSSTIKPAFWRAPTDNDMGARFQSSLKIWKTAQGNTKLINFKSQNENGLLIVHASLELPDVGAKLNIKYTINAKGEMEIIQQVLADTSKRVATT